MSLIFFFFKNKCLHKYTTLEETDEIYIDYHKTTCYEEKFFKEVLLLSFIKNTIIIVIKTVARYHPYVIQDSTRNCSYSVDVVLRS